MNVKYRNENGDCKHCGMPESKHHQSDCPIVEAVNQHHDIVHEVFFETITQLDTWDIQEHPMGTGPNITFGGYGGRASDLCRIMRTRCEDRFVAGCGTYMDILFEEIFEAFETDDPTELNKELIQSAAVIVSMIGALRRAQS